MKSVSNAVASGIGGAPVVVPGGNLKSTEESILLDKVEGLLAKGQPEAALEAIRRSKLHTPSVENATAVCQMRLGNAAVAIEVLRRIVITHSVLLRNDVPVVFKVNFATALCLVGNYSGCLSVLQELAHENHPAAAKLRASFLAWKRQMSIWQRIGWFFGSQPSVPFRPEYPPGDVK